jgi:hypothetical protein
MRYYTYLEEPTLESYRLDHCPRDGLAPVLICWWVNVTGQSGATYNVMRAVQIPHNGVSMNFGACRGTGVLDEPGELVFPFQEHPVIEPYWVEHDDHAVVYTGSSFRLALGVHDYTWSEASGRIELGAHRLGQACTFWVPRQSGYEAPVLSRSHLAKAVGTINGDPVEGIFMVDNIYSRPDLTFRDTQFTRKLHNYWIDWLVEYDDGGHEGGFAWRGQPGTGFAAAHHIVDGRSRARNDARIEVARTERGTMESVELSLGRDVRVVFEQHGSFDWPIHTYGAAIPGAGGRRIVKSWNYSENFPLNWGLVEDYQATHAALFGRYPSLQHLLKGARVTNGALSFADSPTQGSGSAPGIDRQAVGSASAAASRHRAVAT